MVNSGDCSNPDKSLAECENTEAGVVEMESLKHHHPCNIEDDTEEEEDSSTAEFQALAETPEGMSLVDKRASIKLLDRVWGPRLEFVVRLMVVATFLDDSLHTMMHFSDHAKQVGEQGCLNWFTSFTSSGFVFVIATIALSIGLLAQSLGSICLLALLQPDGATKALIAWTIAQPALYGQLSNIEFVTESLSLVGGLLMLRAHLISEQERHGGGARTRLLGRLLLPAVYLYYAGTFLLTALTPDETTSIAMFLSSLSMFFVYAAVFVGLVIGSALVAAGLRSRSVALLLSLVNLGFVCYRHPFFLYLYRENGEWKVDEDNMPLPHATLPKDVSPSDFDAWEIYDLHRYYFFMGLSTSGALLLLAQFGPGEIAIQKEEVRLPVFKSQE